MRASLPTGYMLEQQADGQISIQLCGGGHVDRQAYLDIETGEVSSELEKTSPSSEIDKVCDQSVFADTLFIDEYRADEVKATFVLVASATLPKDVAYIYSTSPPLPARGPPLWRTKSNFYLFNCAFKGRITRELSWKTTLF